MVTQPNGYVNQSADSGGRVSRMKARVPFFREKLKLVEPMSGSFLKVITDRPIQPCTPPSLRSEMCSTPCDLCLAVQALWTEYLCTLFFLYLAVGSIVFGCSSTEVSGGTSGSTGQSGGTTGQCPCPCVMGVAVLCCASRAAPGHDAIDTGLAYIPVHDTSAGVLCCAPQAAMMQ